MFKIRNLTSMKYVSKMSTLIHNSVTSPRVPKKELAFLMNIMKTNGYSINISAENENYVNAKEKFNNEIVKKFISQHAENFLQTVENISNFYSVSRITRGKTFYNFADLKQVTGDEIKTYFHFISQTPKPETVDMEKYLQVWATLDNECVNNLHKMSYDEMLSFMLIFFSSKLFVYSNFYNKCLEKLANDAIMLTKSQIVQTLFYIARKFTLRNNMCYLELCVEERFSEFQIDELTIISLGFFRGRYPIRSPTLVTKIINKVIENSKCIHEISLSTILKVIRYSTNHSEGNKIYELLDCLQYQVPRLNIMCNVQIALLGMSSLILHESCLTKISEKACSEMLNCRLKDMERFALTFGTLNFVPTINENIINSIVDELKKQTREKEINEYKKVFACCVSYLALSNVYPQDLMKRILNRDFLLKYNKRYNIYGEEILRIHNTYKIYFQDSNVSALTDQDVITLSEKYTDPLPNEKDKRSFTKIEHMIMTIKRTLQDIRGGDKYVTCRHILTHHQIGDIIICNDHEGIPLPVDKAFADKKFGMIHNPPDKNTWIVLIIAGRNKIIKNNYKPVGSVVAKEKELIKLGYKTIIVVWEDFMQYQNHMALVFYLENLINQTLIDNK